MCHGRVDGLEVETELTAPVVHVSSLLGAGSPQAGAQAQSHRVHQTVVGDPELLVLSSHRLESGNDQIIALTAGTT